MERKGAGGEGGWGALAAGLGQGGKFISGPAFCSKSSMRLFQPRPRGRPARHQCWCHLRRQHFLLLLGPPVYKRGSQPHPSSPRGALNTLESVFLIRDFPTGARAMAGPGMTAVSSLITPGREGRRPRGGRRGRHAFSVCALSITALCQRPLLLELGVLFPHGLQLGQRFVVLMGGGHGLRAEDQSPLLAGLWK